MTTSESTAILPEDLFVIDPVIHALNLDEANVASRYGRQLYDMSYGLHTMLSPPDARCPQSVYMADMSAEALVRTIFRESATSLAATHTLTLWSWFHDGFCAESKTVEMTTRWPNRMLGYVGIDPTGDRSAILEDLERQVANTPNAIGVKLYPHQMDPYRHWRTNDDKVLALIERAAALGLRTVAIHKALPNGSVPLAPYRISEDFEQAVDAFPDMAFEIVHSGMAFIEETALAIGRFPNVYANLETTTGLLWMAPGRFEIALAQLMQWGGPEKIIYSTGCTVTHPQHVLEAFWQFDFSQEVCRTYGVQPLTEDIRRMILGGNYARMINLDIEDWRRRQANDEFARLQRETLESPWSNWASMQ